MRKCNRYSYGFDFGFQVGDKETRRNEDKGNLRVSFSSLNIATVGIATALGSGHRAQSIWPSSNFKEPLNARRALNGEAFELLNSDSLHGKPSAIRISANGVFTN